MQMTSISKCDTKGAIYQLRNVYFLDRPSTLQTRVECDDKCNFTFESNPLAHFVSLEDESNILWF